MPGKPGLPVMIHEEILEEGDRTGETKREHLAVLKRGWPLSSLTHGLPRLDKLPRDSTCARGHVVAVEKSGSRDGQRQRGRK